MSISSTCIARSGSTLSNFGGTLHNAISIIANKKFNNSNSDSNVTLVEVCISFSLSIDKGESNGKLPLRTCPGSSVSESYQSLTGLWFLPNWFKGWIPIIIMVLLIDSEKRIMYWCDNQLYLRLLLSSIFQCHIIWVYNFLEYHLSILSFLTQYLRRYKFVRHCGTIFWIFLHEYSQKTANYQNFVFNSS